MIALVDSWVSRLLLGILLALVAVQTLLAVAMLGGPFRERYRYAFPLAQQVEAIAVAVEQTPLSGRAAVLAAVNSPALLVRVLPEFPPGERVMRARALERLMRGNFSALQGRELRIDNQRLATLLARLPREDGSDSTLPSPVRLMLRLADGSVLEVSPTRTELLATLAARVAAFAAIAGLVIALLLAIAVRSTVRPLRQLARSARHFASDFQTPDLPEEGPRDLRELATAFNEMQHRIRGLVNERTRMLAAIAHDLRTYLTRLRLRVDFIDDVEQARRAAADLDEMNQLLDDTLYFAAESTRPATTGVTSDPSTLVQDLCAARRETGGLVELASTAGLPRIAVPEAAARRAIANLLDNALRYAGGAHVAVTVADGLLCVAVEDRGPGLPPEEIERLQQPFERLEPSRQRGSGGSGLGLAIARAVAVKYGGNLELANRSGGGLSASLRLPVVEAAQDQEG